MDGQTEIQTDASTTAKTREALHAAARKKISRRIKFRSLRLARILSLAHGKNLARFRSSRFSLTTARSHSRLQVYPLPPTHDATGSFNNYFN